MGLINFAHGDLITIGGYVMWELTSRGISWYATVPVDDPRGDPGVGGDGARRIPSASRRERDHAAHHVVRGQLLHRERLRHLHLAARPGDPGAALAERGGALRLDHRPRRAGADDLRDARLPRPARADAEPDDARRVDARGCGGLPDGAAGGRAGEPRRRHRVRDRRSARRGGVRPLHRAVRARSSRRPASTRS